jgi:hypothetical protein
MTQQAPEPLRTWLDAWYAAWLIVTHYRPF